MNEKEDIRSLFKIRLKQKEEVAIETKIVNKEQFVISIKEKIIEIIKKELESCIFFYLGSFDIAEKNPYGFTRYITSDSMKIIKIESNNLLNFGMLRQQDITIKNFFLKDKDDKLFLKIDYTSSSINNNYYVENFLINRYYLKYNINEDMT